MSQLIGLLFGGIFAWIVQIYFKSLIILRTNQIFLMERGSPKEKGGKFVWCEGILSTRPESGEKVEGFDYETAEHAHPHFNDPRDRKNFDPTYNVGYILFQKWKSWNHKDGTWGADHTYKDPGYQPDFIERHFNRKWPGAPYFMIKKKRYRNHRTSVEYGKVDSKTGQVALTEVIRSREELRAGLPDKRHLFHYTDGNTVIVLYLVSDMSDHFFYEYSYDVLIKVITGVSTKPGKPGKETTPTPDPVTAYPDPAAPAAAPEEKVPFENLQLGLHLRIKVRMRDPEYFCYVSDNMIEEIMAELTEVCQDVANDYDYLKLINSQETDDKPDGYAQEIIQRLEKKHATPKKEGATWKHHAWDLLGMTFKKIVGYREIDQKYLDTISEAPLNIKKEEARRAGLLMQEKNTAIENRIKVSKRKADGEGEAAALDALTTTVSDYIVQTGVATAISREVQENHPNPEAKAFKEGLIGFKGNALALDTSKLLQTVDVDGEKAEADPLAFARELLSKTEKPPKKGGDKPKDTDKKDESGQGGGNSGGGGKGKGGGGGGGGKGGKKRK